MVCGVYLPNIDYRSAVYLPEFLGIELFDQFLERRAQQQFGVAGQRLLVEQLVGLLRDEGRERRVVRGGRGTLIGPVIGAFVVNLAKSFFTVTFPEYWLFFLQHPSCSFRGHGRWFVAVAPPTRHGTAVQPRPAHPDSGASHPADRHALAR